MVTVEVTNGCRYWSGWLNEAINQSTNYRTSNSTHPWGDWQGQAFGNTGTDTSTGHGRQAALIR